MTLYNGMRVFDDSNYRQLLNIPTGLSTGYAARPFNKVPLGSSPYAPLCTIRKIPRSEWSDRIKERKKLGLDNMTFIQRRKLKVKDQNGTNYCWVNAPTYGMEIARARQGLKHVSLSPASLGAKIKNFQNVGGWGLQAIEASQQHGWVPTEKWPDNAIDRRYDTAETRALAKNYMVASFLDITPGDFDMQMTLLLLGWVLASGHNWWGHEILQVDPVEIEPGHFGAIIGNSWGTSWENNGFGILAQSKATADDCQAIMYGKAVYAHAA